MGMLLATAAADAALTPLPIRTTSADEYSPVADGAWMAWTERSHLHQARQNVYVRKGAGSRIKVNPRGMSGGTGGIDGNVLVYSEYKPGYAGDIRKFNLSTHRRSDFPGRVSTRWDEYHPTVSGNWVLFTRWIWTTRTTKVLLYNTHSGSLLTVGTDSGRYRYVYAAQVNGDYATWGRVTPNGQDVYRFHISARTNTKLPRVVYAQYDPVITSDGTVYFVRSGKGCGEIASLVRQPLVGPEAILYDLPVGIDVGYGYAQERADGSLHWLYGRETCRNDRWDIYEVVDSYTLTVTKQGPGTGTVTSDPVGIACGATCSASYHGGVKVTLSAVADPGSSFGGWSDPTCGLTPTCDVTVGGDVSVSATFN